MPIVASYASANAVGWLASAWDQSLSFSVAYATNEIARYEIAGADRNWTLAQWVRPEQWSNSAETK